MSHAAFDIVKTLPGPRAAGSPAASPAAGKTIGGFNRHLQRAGRDGDKTNNGSDDSGSANRASAADSTNKTANAKSKSPPKSGTHRDLSPTKPAANGNADDHSGTKTAHETTPSESVNQRETADRTDDNKESTQDLSQVESTAAQLLATTAIAAPQPPTTSPDSNAVSPSADLARVGQPTTGIQPPPAPPALLQSNLTAAAGIPKQPDAPPPAIQESGVGANSVEISAASDAIGIAATGATAAINVAAAQAAPDIQQPLPVSSTEEQSTLSSPSVVAGLVTETASTSAVGSETVTTDVGAADPIVNERLNGPGESPHATRGPRLVDPNAAFASVVDTQPAAVASSTGSQSSADDELAGRKPTSTEPINGSSSKIPTQTPAQTFAGSTGPSNDSAPAQSTGQSSASSGVGDVDRVRFLQRVSTAFRAADEQGGQIRLRLSPPELGSMKLELTVRNGLMTAHVQAETDTARNMLLDHLPQLRERLAGHNIKIDHFDVELMNQSQGGTPQNSSHNPNGGYTQPQVGARRTSNSAVTAAAALPSSNIRLGSAQLDVTI